MIGLDSSLSSPEDGAKPNNIFTSDAVKLFTTNDDDEEGFNGYTIDDMPAIILNCLRGMRKELRDGNPFRAYLSQNFATNFNTPTIDSGASIKDARLRPHIVTQKQLQYCTKEEMITRLAVATKQQLEDRRAKIVEFRALKQAIRLVKIVDYSAYYAFFMAPQDLRLQPGNVLKVNFSPDNPIRKEDWNLTVSEFFDWSYQGESVGILKRPLVPLQEGATEEEKRAFRPLIGTILPAVDGTMDSPESCRALLESARPVSVLLNYYESEMAEARVFKALNHFLYSTYPNFNKIASQSPNNFNSASMDEWSKVLLMNDNRYGANAKDQLDAIEDLRNTPVNSQGKAVAIIEGFPGVGKTAFLAHVVVCMLAQQPQAPIGCICAANQPTDVLAKAIERAIEDTCNRQPDLAPFLRQQVIIRVCPTATETNFLISLADRASKASIVHDEGDGGADNGDLYTNAVHEGEIMDHSTKSWMNLTSAAVNVNLIEYLVTKCNILPSSLVVLAHYAAQLRARSFEIITASTRQLKTGGRDAPVICKAFDTARKARACVNISKSMDACHSNLLLHRHVHAVGGARAYAT
ncbi:hypothetical protein BCON_0262g00110 [Botryotinia convoluta]|uniref:Uncharacterized protein n=1 Tax=Botryotinia convoluta TaxID=54673 RepID=A0A4Z1HFE8_9HELO|nr:hypothetical protein BCON_0262g00110 [Botryotinia convoluta]